MGLTLLAVACFVGAAFAGPLQRQTQCATQCSTSGNDKFNFEPGKKYVYDYEGINRMSVAGHRKQTTSISAQVELHVLTKCDMVLKVKNAQIQQKATQEETEELTRELEEIPLPFAFEDGKIERVCSSPEESQQSLNIKKGILSAIINTMDSFDRSQEVSEVDSLGTCVTKYTVHEGQQTVIDKEKDLKSCTNRHTSISSIITNPYASPDSAIHSAPIFPTDKLTCTQRIEQGVYKSCSCKEVSSIKPPGQSSAIVEFEGQVSLTLKAVQSAENLRLHPSSSPQAIVYNLQEERSVEDTEHDVVELLRKKCSRDSLIDLSASKDFIYLVGAVRRLSYESLQRIYSSLESGSICSSRKVTDMFLDTLPMAGSDGAIQLMVNLLVQQRVTGLKANLWSASLALVSHPSHEAVKAAAQLVKEHRTKAALLGVSSMVYRHCNHQSCANHQEVKDIVTSLNQVLGQQCAYESESEAVAVLKAFGNMGQILHAEKNILACAKDHEKPVYVRLAAIDAFRRTHMKKPDELLQLYTEPKEDYEVRIAALRSVLSEADRRQISAIKTVAEQEQHEQVAAYSATLIANMNETSSPLKRPVRQRLNQYEINTPHVGYWENSKNIELSTFSEVFNVGGGVEADVIHSPESKVPRSIRTRFDLDVFDNHMNVFEVGLRTEGLEAAFKRLIGKFDSKIQKSSRWSLLKSTSDADDDKLEAQFYFRTMDTEIADFAVSDLTSMSEIIEVADILNKISHERSADFSHSFMFVNSKLVIPSVTGRSYSFGLTGSATVGLTAKSKVDIVNILSKSKNCDVHGHFQPSVNVELAATVGLHSDNLRPDLKIVTHVHSESHIEAQFRIKDSHVALVKVALPSENIAYTKVSSDIIEIDAHHQEKPIYADMQKKIDYCFDKLEKPLGISVCGKWEVPRPFMSKTFPFVKGVGNMELAIKKTDVGMKSLELSIEIPKHRSSVMTYSASLDTPGSSVNRRFSADLEVRMPSNEQTQLSMKLQSPFQAISASASGSLTTRRDLIDGSLEIQAGSSMHYSLKASAPITETTTKKTYRPSVEISYSSSQPLKIEGSVSIGKERRQQISFDLKSNKPSSKPMSLKGTIMKDGHLSISKNAEWKLSSDVSLKSPFVNLNVRSSTEKQARQSHKVSSTLSVDYQTGRSQRESVKLSANFQKSSSKISSVAQFETSKYPSANFILTWNMQGKLRESLKNDVTLKYGRDPERQFVNILQSSRLHESQPGECKFAVKAPQFNIDSDLTVAHDYESNSKLHVDFDLRYKEDNHVRSKLYVDKLSEKPLKLKMKAEVQTPSRRMVYQDELEETSQNSYRGNAAFEWEAGKRTELQYKYQKLSDRSKMHHEIETSLRLPNSQSPIKNKATIQISSENIGIEGRMSLDRRSVFALKAQLNRRGASYVSFKVPKLEGNLKVVNDADKKAADLDLKSSLLKQSRHVTASASLGLGSQKKLETELCLDADRSPEKKMKFSSSFEKQPRNKYACSTKFQILDQLSFEASASGERALYGRQEATVQASLLKFQPVGITLKHELSPSKASLVLRLSRNQRPKAELAFTGERSMTSRQSEVSTSASLQSLDNSFPTKKWSYRASYSRSSQSSLAVKSNTKLEWSPSQIYEWEASLDSQPNVVMTKAFLSTPHASYRKQSMNLSFRHSDTSVQSSASIEFADGKSMSITSETQRIRGDSLKSSLVISSPYQAMRDVRASFSYDNQQSQKSVKSIVDVNGSRKADIEFSLSSGKVVEVRGHMKTSFAPEVSGHLKCENSKHSFKYELQVMKGSQSLMSASLSKQSTNQDVSYSLQARSKEQPLVNLRMSKETSPSSIKHKLEAQGIIPEISLITEYSRKDKNSVNLGVEACLKSNGKSCYSVKGYHKYLTNEENYRYYRKLTVDVEKSSGSSSAQSLASVSVVGSSSGNDYREKFMIDVEEKKVGYDIRFHLRQNEQDHCTLESHIFTPSSTIRVRGSALHNDETFHSDFEIVPDASAPSRKLGFELKREMKRQEMSGYMKFYHPEMRHAIQVSGRIQHEGMIPSAGQLKLNYEGKGQDIVLEIVPPSGSRRQQEKKYVTFKLYREDKSFDASVKIMKSETSRESEYGYEWAYSNRTAQIQGKLSLKFSQEANGQPRAVEFEFNTPRSSAKVSSTIQWQSRIPRGLVFNFWSNNENIFQVDAKAEQDCLYVTQQLKSRPFMDHTVCVFKKEGQKTKLISSVSTYQKRPCVAFEIEVDPDEHHYPTITLTWSERSIRSIKRELQQLKEISSRYISPEDIDSMQKTTRFLIGLYSDLFKDVAKKVKESINQQCDAIEQYYSKVKQAASSSWDSLSQHFPFDYIRQEIIDPVKRFVDKYYKQIYNYLDEHIRKAWESIVKKLTDNLRQHCDRDSFCYGYADAIENMEPEKMKRMLSNKFRSMQKSVSECLENLHFPDIPAMIERFMEAAEKELHRIFQAISDGKLPELFKQYLERLESYISEDIKEKYRAFVDWIRKVLKQLEKDEDFRVLKSLAIDCKDKAWELMQQAASFSENVWRPMCESLKEYPQRWMQEKMTVHKFSPKEGRIEVQIHKPIESKDIQLVRNLYTSMKNIIFSQ